MCQNAYFCLKMCDFPLVLVEKKMCDGTAQFSGQTIVLEKSLTRLFVGF